MAVDTLAPTPAYQPCVHIDQDDDGGGKGDDGNGDDEGDDC